MLIARDYRGDLPSTCIEEFMTLVLDEEDEGAATPILQSEQVRWWCGGGTESGPWEGLHTQ